MSLDDLMGIIGDVGEMTGSGGLQAISDAYGGVVAFCGILALLIGALQCFFGYRIFRVLVAIIGFVIGAVFGALIGALSGGGDAALLLGILFGALGAFIAYKVYKVGVFFSCFGAGLLVGIVIGIGMGSVSAAIGLGCLAGVTLGVMGVAFTKPYLIFCTALGGGMSMGVSLDAMLGGGAIALGIVFTVAGVLVQYFYDKNHTQPAPASAGTPARQQTMPAAGQTPGSGTKAPVSPFALKKAGLRIENTQTFRSNPNQVILVKSGTPLWQPGLPVVITALQIVKDENGSICLNLGLQNLGPHEAIGVFLRVECFDLLRQELAGIEKLAVQDVHIPTGGVWFSGNSFPLPDADTRRCELTVNNVVYADGTIWTNEAAVPLEALPAQSALALTGELTDEFCRILSENVKGYVLKSIYTYRPQQEENFWYCACGQMNTGERCLACGADRARLFEAAEPAYLVEHRQKRLLEEKQREEERRREREAKVENAKQQVVTATTQIAVSTRSGTEKLACWFGDRWDAARRRLGGSSAEQEGNGCPVVCVCGQINPPGSLFCLGCGAHLNS